MKSERRIGQRDRGGKLADGSELFPSTDPGHVSVYHAQELLEKMGSVGASDLILTAGAPPQFRIHGQLKAMHSVSLRPADTAQLAQEVLNPQQSSRLRQQRSVDFSLGAEGVGRFRFNVYYQRGSVTLAIRRIPFVIPDFATLGLPETVKAFASRPHGLVLITGPTGSGKSTTLASIVNFVSQRRSVHIVCIEDPIEYVHRHGKSIVDQREVREDTRSFAEALRSVFRQSPDIILIGEMRDLETIRLALVLAETGHLILGTLHTQDTTNAVNRIVSVFPPDEQQQIFAQLSMVLVGVVAQILLPAADGSKLVLACEVLRMNNAIRNLIRERKTQQIYSVIQTGKDEGMVTLNESLRDLCRAKVILPDLALERSPDPKELRFMLEQS